MDSPHSQFSGQPINRWTFSGVLTYFGSVQGLPMQSPQAVSTFSRCFFGPPIASLIYEFNAVQLSITAFSSFVIGLRIFPAQNRIRQNFYMCQSWVRALFPETGKW